MIDRKPLTEAQHRALGTAAAFYPQGFVIDADRAADRATCDSLVERGDLEAVPGVDGGYRLSDELRTALAIDAARRAEQAVLN